MLTLVKKGDLSPVSLSQIKTHLRLDHSDEDEYLIQLIETATQLVEAYLGRSLMRQTWELLWQKSCDTPARLTPQHAKPTRIALKFPPFIQIIHLESMLENNQLIPIKRYEIDVMHDMPFLVIGSIYEKVRVVYESGYGGYPHDVPGPIRQAIMATVTEYYENRGVVSVPTNNYVQGLLQPYRTTRLV